MSTRVRQRLDELGGRRFGFFAANSKMRLVLLLVLAAQEVAGKPKFKDYWGKFCGVTDCYTELGLYPNATKLQIKRAYRNLSLEFHPDKNPGNRVAADKFRRVARANEVLSSDEERKKLDYYTENPSEYFSLYGSYYEIHYAPKSSVVTVLLFLVAFASAVMYVLQRSKHDQYVLKLERAAVLKLPMTGGGSPESLELRRRAEDVMREKKKKEKFSHSKEKDELKKTIKHLVAELVLPWEFRKPQISQLPIVKVFAVPFAYFRNFYLYGKIEYKKFKQLPLDEAEKQIVIEKFLGGPDIWEALTADQQDELLGTSDCFIQENFTAWLANHSDVKALMSSSSNAIEPPKNGSDDTVKSSSKNKRELRQRKRAGNPAFIMDD